MSVKSAENTAMADETKTASADDKQICKRTRVVGSKFYKKVCATEAQWAARAEADRKTTEDIQRAKAPGVSN
jgi:ABC-type phosphonate transport system ATPase subunit